MVERFNIAVIPGDGIGPDIAGQDLANPLAAILSAALMRDQLKLPVGAKAIRDAVQELLGCGGPRTQDLGGTATTSEVGSAIVEL